MRGGVPEHQTREVGMFVIHGFLRSLRRALGLTLALVM